MRLDEWHEQADTHPLPHRKLAQLQRCTQEARVSADLAGQGDGLARAALMNRSNALGTAEIIRIV